jgi:hypothetical protein
MIVLAVSTVAILIGASLLGRALGHAREVSTVDFQAPETICLRGKSAFATPTGRLHTLRPNGARWSTIEEFTVDLIPTKVIANDIVVSIN